MLGWQMCLKSGPDALPLHAERCVQPGEDTSHDFWSRLAIAMAGHDATGTLRTSKSLTGRSLRSLLQTAGFGLRMSSPSECSCVQTLSHVLADRAQERNLEYAILSCRVTMRARSTLTS